MRLSDIDWNKNCCEANSKHPKVSKHVMVRKSVEESVKKNAKDCINDDEATVLENQRITRITSQQSHEGNFVKARSNLGVIASSNSHPILIVSPLQGPNGPAV